MKHDLSGVIPGVGVMDALNGIARINPAVWATFNRRLKGSPCTFDMSGLLDARGSELTPGEYLRILIRHRPFLLQPLCDMTQEKVYKKGRQMGVSELSITEELWFLQNHEKTKHCHCVPSDAEILTRRGWLHWNEVVEGDETLALDPETHHSRWEKIKAVSVFDYDGKLEAVGPFHCTEEHRWPVERRKIRVNTRRIGENWKWYGGERTIVTTNKLRKHLHKIPRLAPHEHDGTPSVLSPRLAAILGWVATDGHTALAGFKGQKTRRVMMYVTQSSKKYLRKIEKLLGSERRATIRTNAPSLPKHQWPKGAGSRGGRVVGYTSRGWAIYGDVFFVKVKNEDVDALTAVGYRTRADLPAIVSRLSSKAAWAMFEAMVQAEGNLSGRGLKSVHFAQLHGPVLDAFQMLCALLGKYANLNARGAYIVEPGTQKAMLKPGSWKEKRRKYKGKVWCPQTHSGTWYMRYRGKVVFTGNTFPRDKQLVDFSTTRIAETMDETPRMRHLFGVPNQVYTKKIGDSSYLFLRSAWESNLGEGIDCDGVTFDEKDRMKEGIEAAFEESLQSSPYKFIRHVSTPTVPGRGVDSPYSRSKQYEWHVKCVKCGLKQTIDYPDNIVQMKDIAVGAVELPAGAYEYRCRKEKCRGQLDRIHGEWVARYPDRRNISGYWMPQTIAPWLTATNVMQKKIKYKFLSLWENYVLGRTSVGENILLNDDDFNYAIAGHEMMHTRSSDWSQIAVGIDWGHMNWVVVVGRNAENGKLYILGINVFEDDRTRPLTAVADIDKYITPFQPEIIVPDDGYGKDRNSYLLRKYPDKLFACRYNQAEKGGATFTPVWSDEGHRVLVDRTMTIKNTCRAIKEREVGFPRYDRAVQVLISHFKALAPVIDEDENGEIFESIEKTGDDHLVHALGYALIGFEKLDKNKSNFSFTFAEQ